MRVRECLIIWNPPAQCLGHESKEKSLYQRLHSTDATPASFYGLPKIHKPGIPLRPITSCINSPTYNVSRYLVSILTPLLEEKYSVKNSVVFAQHIREQPIAEDEIMVSFDVIALFSHLHPSRTTPTDHSWEITAGHYSSRTDKHFCTEHHATSRVGLEE